MWEFYISLFHSLFHAAGWFHILYPLLKLPETSSSSLLTENDLAFYFTERIEWSEENFHMLWLPRSPTCPQGKYTSFKYYLFTPKCLILALNSPLSCRLIYWEAYLQYLLGCLRGMQKLVCPKKPSIHLAEKKKKRWGFTLPIPCVINLASI